MQDRLAVFRNAVGRIRSRPSLLVVGVVSVALTYLALFVVGRVADWPRNAGPVGYFVGTHVAVVLAAAVRSLFLAPVFAASTPWMGPGPDDPGERTPTGSVDRLWSTASRAKRVALTVPVAYATGIGIGVLALVPVLAGYGLATTALQALGWGLTGGPVVSTALFDAGLAFLVVPVAAAVGVGAVGFAAPAVAAGDRPATAVRESVGRFLARPRRWIGHGVAVVVLLFAPLAVARTAERPGFVEGLPFEVAAGMTVLVAGVCYTLGPVYRTVAIEGGFRASADAFTTDRPGTGGNGGDRLSIRAVVAAVVLSSVVLAGVGAVRVADVRPAAGMPSPPGYDPGTPPGERVAAGMSWLTASDHETRQFYYRTNGSDGPWRLLGRTRHRYDVDRARAGILSIDGSRAPGVAEFSVERLFLDRSVVLRRQVVVTENLSRVAVDPGGTFPEDVTDSAPWRRERIADGTGPVVPHPGGVPTATRFVHRLAETAPGAFREVEADGDRVVLQTVDATAYCRVWVRDCDRYPVVEGEVRVVLDADTGVPVEMSVTTIRRRSNPAADESPTFGTRREYQFDAREVTVTRPPDAPRGLRELIADAIVY